MKMFSLATILEAAVCSVTRLPRAECALCCAAWALTDERRLQYETLRRILQFPGPIA